MEQIGRRGKVPYQGQMRDAMLVEPASSNEPWNEYVMPDGTRLKSKSIAVEIWRVLDEYDAQGEPIYLIKSKNVASVSAPDGAKRPDSS